MHLKLLLVGSLALFFSCGLVARGGNQLSSAEKAKFFESQVLPILQANCITCHGGEKVRSGFKLISRDDLLKGGKRGPAISLGRPDESLLIRAVEHLGPKMPPKGKLPEAQIDILRRWVKIGTPWADAAVMVTRRGPSPVDEEARRFWSFRQVVRPPVPRVKDTDWAKTPIDAFILAKLEAQGLQPAPPAEKTSLLRRVYYDLIGLPPTPEEVKAFVADDSASAYEKLVDRLLASPRYGERWARHWLDLVRYAETNGYEFDAPKPYAWRYRDYVIKSLNEDKPYDRFVKEQLAGDELEPSTTEGLIATGYYRLGPWDGGAPDRLQATYDDLDDVVATTGQVFLGLTVNCARCHDHKNDPFPQTDYYRLLAFFHGIQRYNPRNSVRPIGDQADQAVQRQEIAEYQKRKAVVAERMKAMEDALRPYLEAGERDDFEHLENRLDIFRKHVPRHVSQDDFESYESLGRESFALERRKPLVLARALCVAETGRTPPETYVLLRGNPRARGEKVEPAFPSVLSSAPPAISVPDSKMRTSGRRRLLAEWIASPANPLTARVMVNRLWQHHFGRGIVRSSSDFGFRGAPPTHPELLDWLASECVAGGWKVKPIHKLIVMSAAYQMSSRPDQVAQAKDPENDLFWRFDLRRLSAEELRDSILLVSGQLDTSKIGGPSVYPRISAEVLAGQSRPGDGWALSSPREEARRSVYVHVKRSLIVPILSAFDTADTDASCPVRFATTQPTQALGMLNSEFLNEAARIFAHDVCRLVGDNPAAAVRLALRRVTQREPTEPEIERGVNFLAQSRKKHGLAAQEALQNFCLLTLNLNEFIYLN
jgi:mono/diheme cytochrome c family protein